MTNLFESKPRWPGAPRICVAANLPAFDSMQDLERFVSTNGPSCKIRRKWQCDQCGCYHAKVQAPDPTGASNGGGRGNK